MNRIITNPRARLYLIAAVILAVGLSSSVLIYATAENGSDSALADQMQNTKLYRHDLELIGGKANVLADEFRRWLEGLWHGKTLAFTVGFITVVAASGFIFVAYHSDPDPESAESSENQRDGSG